MKIKLVTFAPHPNFGTCLQSYALNKVLRDMGHDVEFIYNGREKPPRGQLFYIKKVIKKIVKFFLPSIFLRRLKKLYTKDRNADSTPLNILTLPNNYLRYIISYLPFYDKVYKYLKCRTLQWKKVYSFTFEDGNYKMKRLYCRKQYKKVVKDADLFITGSDQIWNPYCGGFNPMMFLEFAGDKKRIAYSSSISRPFIPEPLKERYKCDLNKFRHIAVREQKSVELLSNLLGRNDIKLVVDPTYLLSSKEWEDFAENRVIEFELPKNYIFCYFVGDRYDFFNKMVEEVKKMTGINNVITLECYNRDLNYGGGRLYKDAGPYEWVYLLKHASYVCMDSFHATVFALKFHKEFVHALKSAEEGAKSQNTRIFDILGRYNLLYKIYDRESNNWFKTINYTEVDNYLDSDIKDSIEFLNYEVHN